MFDARCLLGTVDNRLVRSKRTPRRLYRLKSIELNDFVHESFPLPRWAWRSVGAATALGLLLAGEVVGALGAVVAFTTAEVVFDAADLER